MWNPETENSIVISPSNGISVPSAVLNFCLVGSNLTCRIKLRPMTDCSQPESRRARIRSVTQLSLLNMLLVAVYFDEISSLHGSRNGYTPSCSILLQSGTFVSRTRRIFISSSWVFTISDVVSIHTVTL